jgi:hypothetical protein
MSTGGTGGGAPPPPPPAPDASLDGGAEAGSDAGDVDACPPHSARCGGDAQGCGTDLDANPHHCGACGHDCLGGSCAGGACQVVDLLTASPLEGFQKALTVDASNVYWSLVRAFGATQSGIYACPLSGCVNQSPTVLLSNIGEPQSLTLNGGVIYWSDGSGSRTVLCPPSGCGQSPTACAVDQPAPGVTLTDGVNLYWSDQGTAAASSTDGRIMKASIANPSQCGAAETLAAPPRRPADLALDRSTLYWVIDPSTPATADGTLFSCPTSGCNQTPTTLVSGILRPASIAARGGSVFWASDSTHTSDGHCNVDGAVYACTNCKGTPKSLLQNVSCPGHLAADDDYIYFIESDPNGFSSRVWRVHPDGSGKESVVESKVALLNIALDDKAVYFISLGGWLGKRAK